MLKEFKGVILAEDMLEDQDKDGLIKIIGSYFYKTHIVSHALMLFLSSCRQPLSWVWLAQ
jgi:hypothetical protein